MVSVFGSGLPDTVRGTSIDGRLRTATSRELERGMSLRCAVLARRVRTPPRVRRRREGSEKKR
ncbi:hypothetical protein C5613_27590 [Rhodococcus opacus]|uniref:Uncharacterized protein n=1 Tax=Rhodococcus opacus TaxID=37919 RepID=A0A2S8J0J2_RHOOP|nr:hypothetical protein C5613_27590 [Rhodococcus opacus]